MTGDPPAFTRSQRRQLQLVHGLQGDQVDALSHALRPLQAMHAADASMDEVRSVLADYSKAAKALHKATRRLAMAQEGTASAAAREHVEAAVHDAGMIDDMDELLLRLTPIVSASEAAIAGLSPRRRSTLSQNPVPVSLIVDALKSVPGGVVPCVTHTTGTRFRAIVDICYAAAGVGGSAERSIRAYQKSHHSSGTVPRKKTGELSH